MRTQIRLNRLHHLVITSIIIFTLILVLYFNISHATIQSTQKYVTQKLEDMTKDMKIEIDLDDSEGMFQKLLPGLISTKLDKDIDNDLWEINKANDNKLPLLLDIPDYYMDKKINKPAVQPFDPRFSLGVYLQHIVNNMDKIDTDDEAVLPFNWQDWVDTSALDKYILYHNGISCEQLFKVRSTELHPSNKAKTIADYCTNDPKSALGFKIFAHPGLHYTEKYVLAGRAYLYDQMQTPTQIVFLTNNENEKGEQSLKVKVERSEENIINNGIVEQLVKKGAKSVHVGKSFSKMQSSLFKDRPSQGHTLPYKVDLAKEEFRVDSKATIEQMTSALKKILEEQKEKEAKEKEKEAKEKEAKEKEAKEKEAKEKEAKEKEAKEKDAKKEQPKKDKDFAKDKDSKNEKDTKKEKDSKKAKRAESGSEPASKKDKPPSPKEVHFEPEVQLEYEKLENFKDALEFSEAKNDDPPKYFFETNLLSTQKGYVMGLHYDWRFYNGVSESESLIERESISLHQMLRTWLKFTQAHNLKTWLAHGTLLSWYWNGMSFPWDSDIDFQMPIEDLYKLGQEFNQSIIVENILDGSGGYLGMGRYLLDVGSTISSRSPTTNRNNIDARFIDLDTGLFIDITGLSTSSLDKPARYNGKNKDTIYNDRFPHHVSHEDLSPLILTKVDNVYAYVPSNFEAILNNEYSSKGMSEVDFSKYFYLPNFRMWVETGVVLDYLSNSKAYLKVNGIKEKLTKRVAGVFEKIHLKHLTEKQHVEILSKNSLLIQYLTGHDIAKTHEQELKLILAKDYTASQKLIQFSSTTNKPLRKDAFSYKYFRNHWRWDRALASTLELGAAYVKADKDKEAKPQKVSYQN